MFTARVLSQVQARVLPLGPMQQRTNMITLTEYHRKSIVIYSFIVDLYVSFISLAFFCLISLVHTLK